MVEEVLHIGQPRRVSGQIVLDALLVADVGKNFFKNAEFAGFVDRNEQSALDHQLQQSHRFHRDRLAPGVGARQYEYPILPEQGQVEGDGFATDLAIFNVEQGVKTHLDAEVWPVHEFGHDAAHFSGESRFGLNEIEPYEEFLIPTQRIDVGTQDSAQVFEDAVDLALLLILQIENIVVDVDDLLRLDESRAPGARFVVNDAPDLALVFRRYGKDAPPVPKTFYVIGQPAPVAVLRDQIFEHPVHFAPPRQHVAPDLL